MKFFKFFRKKYSKERYVINCLVSFLCYYIVIFINVMQLILLEFFLLGFFSEVFCVWNIGCFFGVGGVFYYDIFSDKFMNVLKILGLLKSVDIFKFYFFSILFIGGQGQLGGSYILWVDFYKVRQDWKEKFEYVKVLRVEINDVGKVCLLNFGDG